MSAVVDDLVSRVVQRLDERGAQVDARLTELPARCRRLWARLLRDLSG